MNRAMQSGIEDLASMLATNEIEQERLAILHGNARVRTFLESKHPLRSIVPQLEPRQQSVLFQLIALDQAPLSSEDLKDVADQLSSLCEVDRFYRELGGIVGYQMYVLKLLNKQGPRVSRGSFHSPSFIDISKRSPEVDVAIEQGIVSMEQLCELYPLGGAADRLHLIDDATGSELPAAKLQFAGKTLLERLLCDLEAREHLYFQRMGKKISTPVAIMTSHEKNNNLYVQEILEENRWFNRPKELFKLFVQPLVPVVNEKGDWLWDDWKLLMKPGGHGAIWKLARDQGVFDWLESNGAKYALIRQINNPLAGLDYGLLAFTGLGVSRNMSFGFASCPRVCRAAEGMNVLIERKEQNGYSYHLSNIEYCDFERHGIEDAPLHPGEPYSRFTSNTNILFADLNALKKAVSRCPFPGLLMNLKKDANGCFAGRLESTMQNISDVFVEKTQAPLLDKRLDKTFITYNDRMKTISTAKKAYITGGTWNETPEKCFFDLMCSAAHLLKEFCRASLPLERSLEETLAEHPSFVFLYHPTLGPLYQTIGEKIRNLMLSDGSELRLEISDLLLNDIEVNGSLQVVAPMGFSCLDHEASCVMKNCKIENRGIDWKRSAPFWRGNYFRSETLLIELGAGAKFVAENITFCGNRHFVVPENQVLIVTEEIAQKNYSRA